MSKFVEGAIIRHSWGYEQTNIDYFKIIKRTEGKGVWLTLQAMTQESVHDSLKMTGVCVPGKIIAGSKPIRRKLLIDSKGEERGIAIERSYGWGQLWDGKPSHYSSYG